jgi:phosphatidylglycerophosphatase A
MSQNRRYRLWSCFGLDRVKNGVIICTLIATLFGLGVAIFVDNSSLVTLSFALGVVGFFEIKLLLKSGAERDSIILIKALGVWLTLNIAILGALQYKIPYPFLLGGILSFVLFLLFTLWRPSTIGWLDREFQNALGVVLSEVLAGFASGVLILFLFSIFRFDSSPLWSILLN